MDNFKDKLAQFEPEEQAAILKAIEYKRRKDAYIKYWRPNSPGQWEGIRQFTKDVKVMGVRGGNRAGKTVWGAAVVVAWALGKEYFINEPAYEWVKDLPIPPPPNNIWAVALDFNVIRDVIWREKFMEGRGEPAFVPKAEIDEMRESEFWIKFKNGSRITCKSADSGREKFQSASVNLVWIDEECDVEVFDECYQRTADCAGKIVLTLTPLTDIGSGQKVPWVSDLEEDVQSGKSKNVKFIALSVMDNPTIPEEEKANLLSKWAGHPEERARLYGEYIQRAGLVYPMWNTAKHVVNPRQIPKSWSRIACIDPAPTGVTACLWGAIEPETNNLFLYREYYEPNQTIGEHAKNIILYSSGDNVDTWLIDPFAGPQSSPESHKSIQQLYKDAGIPVRLAQRDAGYALAASKEYVLATTIFDSRHPKVFVHETLTNFKWEISRYTWAFYGRGDMKGLSKEKPVKRNDHLMNCFQYICASNPRSRARVALMTAEARAMESKLNSYT